MFIFQNTNDAVAARPIEALAHPEADLVLLKYDFEKLQKKILKFGGPAKIREFCVPKQHIPMSAPFDCYLAGWGMTDADSWMSVTDCI